MFVTIIHFTQSFAHGKPAFTPSCVRCSGYWNGGYTHTFSRCPSSPNSSKLQNNDPMGHNSVGKNVQTFLNEENFATTRLINQSANHIHISKICLKDNIK